MSIVPRPSFSDDSRNLNKHLPKSQLLRDYLLNDTSSCSSNGFKSYPRRPTTTVKFLVEMELNKNNKLPIKQHGPPIIKSKINQKSNLYTKQSSVLQRASTMMIKAFKCFSFVRNRNLSRQVLKYSLWKKSDHRYNEIKQLKSLSDLLKETELTQPPSQLVVTNTATNTPLTSSNNNSNSNSDSSFTAANFTTIDSFESELCKNDVVDVLLEDKELTKGNRVGATTTTATTNYYDTSTSENSKKWQNDQEEQLSPVSVMDFSSDNDNEIDDEDKVSSLFQHRHLYVEGPKKFMPKARRFDDVPGVEPVKLEDRIAQSILESSTQKYHSKIGQEDNECEKKAMEVFQLMKSTTYSHHILKYEAFENLLLDFFKEKMVGAKCSNHQMLQIVKDWINGQAQEMVLDWECSNDRQIYITEMEDVLRWSKYDDEVEKQNTIFELECAIFNSLVDDIVRDLYLQVFCS